MGLLSTCRRKECSTRIKENGETDSGVLDVVPFHVPGFLAIQVDMDLDGR